MTRRKHIDSDGRRELRLLETLARAIIRKQQVRPVMQKLADALVGEFGFKAALVTQFIPSQKGFTVLGIAPRRKTLSAATQLLGINLDRLVFPFRPDKNSVLKLLLRRKVWIGKDLSEIIKPMFAAKPARLVQRIFKVRCIYNSPLFSGNHLVGTMIVGTEAESFTKRQIAFLKAFTQHAALAVHQAGLLAEKSAATERYRLLSEVDSHILEEKELRKVLKAIVGNIHRVISCDLAGVYIHDPARKTMVHSVAWPASSYAKKLRNLEFPIGTGIIGSVARTRKAEIVNNAHEDRRSVYPRGSQPRLEHLICLPLIVGKNLVGVLHVGRFHDEPFLASDLEMAKQFGGKSALAIENAQLFAKQRQREAELEELQRSGTRITELLDLRTVLDRVLAEARRVVPAAERGCIYLVEEGTKDLVLAADVGADRRVADVRIPWGAAGIAKVAQSARSVVVEDAFSLAEWNPEGAKHPAASLVVIPLLSKNRAMGVLKLGSTSRQGAFTRDDVTRLELFALHASLAIRNAQLLASLEQEVKKIKLLRDIKALTRSGSSTSVFLRQVCRLMVEAYGYHLTTVLLYDPLRQTLKLAAAGGSEASKIPKDYEQSIQDGVVGWVARTRKPRLVQNAVQDPHFINRNELSTQSELCVPILDAGANLLGVINTESNRIGGFKETDVQTQSAVASEIAGAFAEQRLITALSDSERKFRRLFEESKDAIYISTIEGVLLDVNQAAVDLFGYPSKEELMKVDIARDLYLDPSDRDDLLEELAAKGFLKDVELRLKKKSGYRLLVHATVTSLRDSEDRPVALQGILHDITRQKDDERRLHESEEKYRSLVEDALVGVYIIQNDKFSFVNSRFGEIFGYPVVEISDMHVGDFVHPDDRTTVIENIRKRMRGDVKSMKYGFRGLRKDGMAIEVEVFGTRSVYQGQPAVIGTILDRTQEHRQQTEIDEWKRRYELIIASSAQIVYEYNIRTGAILWGGSIEAVLGYKLSDLRGEIKEWEEFIHPEDRERALKELDQALATTRRYDAEYRYRRKDGSYAWMHDRGFVVSDKTGWGQILLGMMEDVTQSRVLEEKFYFSEQKHRLLFEHANDAVLVLRGELITDCNPRALEMFGSSKEDLLGQSLYAFSPPYQVDGKESRSTLLEYLNAGLEGNPQKFSWRNIRRDGSGFEAEVRLNRFELAGEILLQVQIRDTTVEVEAQEELARSEETYRRLILEASDPILVSDGNGRFVEVNQAACFLLGYSREELLKLSAADLSELPPEEALAAYRTFYSQLIVEERVAVADRTMRRKDDTMFPAEMSAVLLGNGLLQAIIRDVSEKKQAEKELDKIYTLATTFHGQELFDRAAGALAEMLSMSYVSIGEVRGQEVHSMTLLRKGVTEHNTVHSLIGSPCEKILMSKDTCIHSDGAADRHPNDLVLRSWNIQAFVGVPMFDSRREVIGIVSLLDEQAHEFSDHEKRIISVIAQRLASELEMLLRRKREEQLSEQLAQSQKMESLGTLAGGVAHDFNNILGAVIGYTSLIKKRVEADEQTSRYLEAIEKSAQRAASLSKQLLSFSHKTHGEIKPVSVNELIQDTIHIIASSFPKDIAIETHLAEALPLVLGDQNLLGQAVMNLCINARDAVAEHTGRHNGNIIITTTPFSANAGFIDLHLSAAPGDYVCLTVRDNGVGMGQEVRSRIFEPFYTTKGKGRGTGLGLSMVYGIIRNHNGFIDLHTEVGKGTEFKIFLPAAVDPQEEKTADVEELPQGNGELIMIVEDEPMLRDLVADVLKGQGYGVLVASNGKEAVELYQTQKEKTSLVILDMIMPEMDGQATFRALRAINPSLKVLISSGFSQENTVQRLLSDGAAGFVGKPYQTDDLLKIVANQLRS
ncbi:MAG: PAS domain S-box protein [Bacteroidota bacterium]